MSKIEEPSRKRSVKSRVFQDPNGIQVAASAFESVSKLERETIAYCHGQREETIQAVGKKKAKTLLVTDYDPENPMPSVPLKPSAQSPICIQCGLHEHKSRSPFTPYSGPARPVVTIIFDSVTRPEDVKGELGADGSPAIIKQIIQDSSKETGVTADDIRWVPMTRCTNWLGKAVNFKTHGNWCRYHVVDDLMRNPPALVMPVGTTALGLLSHKSNAQEWSGRLLTYRGWPDDWLTNPKYALPRPDPRTEGKFITGHPLFGPVPDWKIPMVPIQTPRLVQAQQNDALYGKWIKSIIAAVKLAKSGIRARDYLRDWYRWTTDVDSIEYQLNELLRHPGISLCYDTETTGLRPWADDAAIVSIMLRWDDPASGQPKSLGFPWDYSASTEHPDYETSPIKPYIKRLKPLIWKVLTRSTLIGHNLTFDVLYTYATFWKKHLCGWDNREINIKRDEALCALANAGVRDTLHMAFAWQQKRGSLGLEAIAYDWVPEFAGYEEDMTLLIELHNERMHPGAGKQGHYLNCPDSGKSSQLVSYVMGDVEVCYRAHQKIQQKLESSRTYTFPIADPDNLGRFRDYTPPNRDWVYHNIMSPASRVLMKMMARGLYIDKQALYEMELSMPKQIDALRAELRNIDPRILSHCEEQEAKSVGTAGGKWVLDLENKSQLKELLFKVLKLPVLRFTKQGRQIYGEDIAKVTDKLSAVVAAEKPDLASNPSALADEVQARLSAIAAVDKFTLNKLMVDHAELRPLQDYRKVYKLYSTYVRPLRNLFSEGIDKKKRTGDMHLCFDQCVHASFLLAGTRGGRLACKSPNLQQLPRDGAVKQMFVSRFGPRGCIYQGDLSQIELRLLAAACGDPTMVRAYFDEVDLHSLTTSRIFDVPYEHFSKDYMKKLQQKGLDKKAKELDEKRSVGKCVDPNTLVSVNDRVVRIGSLHAGRKDDTFYPVNGMLVQTPTGQHPIKNFYCSGEAETVLICSRRGLYSCGFEHRIALADGSLKRAADIRVGDTLAGTSALKSGTDAEVKIQINPFGRAVDKSSRYTISIDSKMAYFLGIFYGDGTTRIANVSITTGGRPEHHAWQDIVVEAVKDAGFEPRLKRCVWDGLKESPKMSIDGSFGMIEFGSTRVKDILFQIGAVDFEGNGRKTLRIPEWLFNASTELKIQFMAGLIDTDGSCSRGCLSWTTAKWEFAQDVCVLLKSLDCTYTLEPLWNTTYERYYYRVNITLRSGFDLFHGVLRHPEKAAFIRAPKFRYRAETPNVVRACIPLGKRTVFDLEVDSSEHEYLINGLRSHNTVNFLTGYGGGAFGLLNVLAMKGIYKTIEECEHIIEMFFESYPALRTLLQKYKRFIMDRHVAVSMFGRVRIFEEVAGNDEEAIAKALRAGCNHLIQSTASDMMLTALFVIENMMRAANLESQLVSTVHDSLVIDAVRSELPEIHDIVLTVMNNFPEVFKVVFGEDYDTSWMIVPFTGDTDCGVNYLSTFKLAKENVDWDEVNAKLSK